MTGAPCYYCGQPGRLTQFAWGVGNACDGCAAKRAGSPAVDRPPSACACGDRRRTYAMAGKTRECRCSGCGVLR